MTAMTAQGILNHESGASLSSAGQEQERDSQATHILLLHSGRTLRVWLDHLKLSVMRL